LNKNILNKVVDNLQKIRWSLKLEERDKNNGLKQDYTSIEKLINIYKVMLTNDKLEYKCERCDHKKDVIMCSAMTCYHWDGKGEDPNRDFALCEGCAEEHYEYWDDMWREYYSGLI